MARDAQVSIARRPRIQQAQMRVVPMPKPRCLCRKNHKNGYGIGNFFTGSNDTKKIVTGTKTRDGSSCPGSSQDRLIRKREGRR